MLSNPSRSDYFSSLHVPLRSESFLTGLPLPSSPGSLAVCSHRQPEGSCHHPSQEPDPSPPQLHSHSAAQPGKSHEVQGQRHHLCLQASLPRLGFLSDFSTNSLPCSLTDLRPHWPLHGFQNRPKTLLPQSLCSCSFFCLDVRGSPVCASLLSGLCSDVTFSVRPS